MKRKTLAALALILIAGQAIAQNPPDPAAMKAQGLLADLFIGITAHDPQAVKSALEAGADPNGRNWLGMTPLMWASSRGNKSAVDALLARGAKINDPSIYGAAATFATLGRHGKLTQYLISKGAATTANRVDKGSILAFAAAGGDAELIAKLLAK